MVKTKLVTSVAGEVSDSQLPLPCLICKAPPLTLNRVGLLGSETSRERMAAGLAAKSTPKEELGLIVCALRVSNWIRWVAYLKFSCTSC